MWIHRYTVKGSGPFPMDMLRYDASYPSSTGDASAMTTHARGEFSNETRSVELTHTAERRQWTPTDARWRSFGWTVSKIETPYKI